MVAMAVLAMAVLTLPFALLTGHISPASPLHLPRIAPASPPHLPHISPAPPNVSRQVMADAFIKEMEAFDGEMEKKYSEAEAAGNCLRFVGVVDVPGKKCSVELRQYPKTHPFAGTQYAATLTAHYLLFTVYCSLLTAYCLLLSTQHSPLSKHHSALSTGHAPGGGG